MSKRIYLVDTNILVKYLLNDDYKQSLAARKFLKTAYDGKAILEIPFVVITETVFVLHTKHNLNRVIIGEELLRILLADNIKMNAPVWIIKAIEEFKSRGISFGDACIAAEARFLKLPIASFDRDFDKFKGVKRYEPK